jgi:Helix-turn-helix domain of resolvase
MAFVSKLSPEQWAEARRLRADGMSCEAIARQFGISVSAMAARARREGWPSPVADHRAAGARRTKPGASSPATAGIRSRLALRLYKVIEFRIRMMELRMLKQLQALSDAQERDPEGSAPPAPTKDERESFAALIESINQVTEMASEPAPAAGGRRRTATGAINPELTALSDDIDPDGLAVASAKDEYRRELAEHLARMFPKS